MTIDRIEGTPALRAGFAPHHGDKRARSTGPRGAGGAPGPGRRPPGASRGVTPMPEMPDVLKLHADGTPDKHAVIVDASHGARPSVTTFAELNQLVNRLVHGLGAVGAEQGDRIVWCGPNSLEVVAVIHAARKAGLVAVPLSYRFNAEEMQYVIDNSDATLVIADAEYAPVVAESMDRLPKVRAYIGFSATDDAPALPPDW